MGRFRNTIFLLLLVFLFFEILIVFPGRLDKNDDLEEKQKKLLDLSQNPEQKMQGLHLVESQHGHRDWELSAEAAKGSQEKEIWEIQKVKVSFYNKEKVEYTVTGDQGLIDGKTRNMTIEGHVVTQSANGYVFKTEQVYYLAQDRKIRTPGKLEMTGPAEGDKQGLKLTGNRMTIFVDQSLMKIDSEVRSTREMADHKFLEISSEGAEFSGQNRETKFLGQVRMKYNQMEISGPEASFKYSADSKMLNSIEVKGGVQAKDQQKFATAENLLIDILNQKMTFKGKPKLVQDNDELNGDQIVFLDGGKKVKIEKVKAKMEGQNSQ